MRRITEECQNRNKTIKLVRRILPFFKEQSLRMFAKWVGLPVCRYSIPTQLENTILHLYN